MLGTEAVLLKQANPVSVRDDGSDSLFLFFDVWLITGPSAPAHDNITLADGSVMSLQALRRGVRNERGDMAYFLPSFLEDPWRDLGAEQA